MNILVLMPLKVYPAVDGGLQGLRVHHRMLHQMGVKLYGVMSNVDDACEDWREYMPEFEDLLILRRCHPQVGKQPLKALLEWLLSGKPRRAQVLESRENKKYVMDYIEEHNIDTIILELPFTAEYVDFEIVKEKGIRIVLVEHNVEYIYEQEALSKYGCLAWLEISRMKKYERNILPQADMVVTVSPTDQELLEREFGLTNVVFLPIPMEMSDIRWKEAASKYIIFNGSLNSYVNYYSMREFCKTVFPKYVKHHPEMKLLITGGVKDSVRKEFSHANIEFTGFVSEERLHELLCSCRFMVSPITIGSGTKLKLIEGLSMGIPIVASGHCFEGVPFTTECEKPYLVASRTEEYFEHMSCLTESAEARNCLSSAAVEFFYDTFVSPKNRKKWATILGIEY